MKAVLLAVAALCLFAADASAFVKPRGSALGRTWAQIERDLDGDVKLAAWPSFRAFNNGIQYNTVVLGCAGFATSGGSTTGNCDTQFGAFSGSVLVITGTVAGTTPGVVGSEVDLMVAGCNHCAVSLIYQQLVNIQKFKTTFTFISNGWNFAFTVNNSNNNPGNNGANFSAGAGCEGGFFQGFSQTTAPNNVFAVMFDSYSGRVAGMSGFDYSGVQYYQGAFASNAPNPPGQSPCNPDLGGTDFTYAGVNKVSTSPVPLNNPVNASWFNGWPSTSPAGTGDLMQSTITYDGNNLTVTLFDVTAGGTCTPVTSPTCFTTTWSGVNVPAMVGANTGYIAIMSSTANNFSTFNQMVTEWLFNTP